jgi:hypothetical protein
VRVRTLLEVVDRLVGWRRDGGGGIFDDGSETGERLIGLHEVTRLSMS